MAHQATHLVAIAWALLTLIIFAQGSRLRACNKNGRSIEVDTLLCPRGSWLPEPMQTSCICVTGVWYVSESYCSDTFFLLASPPDHPDDLQCFPISAKIRRLAHMSPPALRVYSHYLIDSSRGSIEPISTPEFTPPPNSSATLLIRVNAFTYMKVEHVDEQGPRDWCPHVQRPSNWYFKGANIHIITSPHPITYFKSLTTTNHLECEATLNNSRGNPHPNYPTYNKFYHNGLAWSPQTAAIQGKCSCDPPTSHPLHTHTAPDLPPTLHLLDTDYDSAPRDISDPFSLDGDPLLKAERLRDNSQMTAAMLSRLKDYLLLSTTPPTPTTPSFSYIRFARKALLKLCPELPSHTITNMFTLFRVLIADVLSRYPDEYANNLDADTHQRVTSVLNTCIRSLKPVTFFWKRQKPDCENKAVSMEFNGTSVPIVGMPANVAFNRDPERTDLVLEVAWKGILAAHYACANYFESSPSDLSFMYVKSHEFLSIPSVLFRWENPAPYLTRAYKFLDPWLNPETLAEQIDSCVFSAFTISPYNNWLTRPSSKEFSRTSILKTTMARLAGRSSTATKGFSDRGYCVHQFSDPAKWSSIDERIGAKC